MAERRIAPARSRGPRRRLTNPDGVVFAEYVDDAPEAWEVVGYDDAGVELHRFGWLAGPAATISSG